MTRSYKTYLAAGRRAYARGYRTDAAAAEAAALRRERIGWVLSVAGAGIFWALVLWGAWL